MPDTPTRKVVPRKSIAYPRGLKSNSRFSNSSMMSSFNPSIEIIRAALAAYEKSFSEHEASIDEQDKSKPDVQG